MKKDEIWKLFEITGNINYYLKYIDMNNKGIDKLGDNESKWHNN